MTCWALNLWSQANHIAGVQQVPLPFPALSQTSWPPLCLRHLVPGSDRTALLRPWHLANTGGNGGVGALLPIHTCPPAPLDAQASFLVSLSSCPFLTHALAMGSVPTRRTGCGVKAAWMTCHLPPCFQKAWMGHLHRPRWIHRPCWMKLLLRLPQWTTGPHYPSMAFMNPHRHHRFHRKGAIALRRRVVRPHVQIFRCLSRPFPSRLRLCHPRQYQRHLCFRLVSPLRLLCCHHRQCHRVCARLHLLLLALQAPCNNL